MVDSYECSSCRATWGDDGLHPVQAALACPFCGRTDLVLTRSPHTAQRAGRVSLDLSGTTAVKLLDNRPVLGQSLRVVDTAPACYRRN